jgi:hypothetical protein
MLFSGWCLQRIRSVFTVRYELDFYVTLYEFQDSISAMAQVVKSSTSSRRQGFVPRPAHVRFVMDKGALNMIFHQYVDFLPRQYQSTMTPYSSSSICCIYRKYKWTKPGQFQHSNEFSEIGKRRIEKYFPFSSGLRILIKKPKMKNNKGVLHL